MSIILANEQATITFGQMLAKCLADDNGQPDFPNSGLNIYLHGDLGAGKTTLVRGLVQYFLPGAKVKSPTYTLVEDYDITQSALHPPIYKHIYHFDLYRLGDPEELEYLGGRDYFAADALCLVEWPERGEGWLAKPDLEITLNYQQDGRKVDWRGHTQNGNWLSAKMDDFNATDAHL